jgi:TRAP-type C4-dicarboxylate transport system permease small subunit
MVVASLLLHGLALRRLGAEVVDRWTRRIEQAVFTAFIAVMLLLSGLQVILRNFFHGGVLWIDPLVRTLILWVAFLGALAATSQVRHLHVDVMTRLLPERLERPIARVLSVVAAVCCALLANAAFTYLRDEYQFGVSPFLGVPSWAAQSVLLWGFMLLTYRFFVQALWPTARVRRA